MARSHAVWVVMAWDYPIATFTVKHELKSWLGKRNRAALEKDCQIYRLHDGDCECQGRITAIDIGEILK